MRNVLVTGASRGIGVGIVRRLIGSGFRAIAIARTQGSQINAVLEEAERTQPGSLHFRPFDLLEVEGIPDLVKKVRKEFGPIYGLVNNAGASIEGALAMTSTSQMEKLVRLNVLSPMVMSKHVVGGMMSGGGGRIVNISSIIATTGFSGLSVYGATKAALIGFTRSLAREVGRMNVTVNAVAPGFIDTDLTQETTDEQREQIVRRSALRRLAEVDDVAGAVEFLLSEAGKNVTGTVLTVDAGSTA
jgi:3-oxoacyl-[acyl-carrier protein] reductase